MHDEVIGAIKQIKSLHAHRNTIIHSTWRKGLIEREEDTVTRPWGKRDDQVPWAAFRSRQRVYAPHSEWTISDIELLADKMTDAGEALMRDFARMYQHAHPFIIADTKWVRWLPTR